METQLVQVLSNSSVRVPPNRSRRRKLKTNSFPLTSRNRSLGGGWSYQVQRIENRVQNSESRTSTGPRKSYRDQFSGENRFKPVHRDNIVLEPSWRRKNLAHLFRTR